MIFRFSLCFLAVVLLTLAVPPRWRLQADDERKPKLEVARRPVALAWSERNRKTYVANRHSGTITTIDDASLHWMHETKVGKSLEDLVSLSGGDRLLAVDSMAHELLLIAIADGWPAVQVRMPVSQFPVCVRVAVDGRRCFVASLWSRKVTVVDVDKSGVANSLRIARIIDVPFAPRLVLPALDNQRLVVADAFGGKLAVVNVATGAIESTRVIPAHNIRGLILGQGGKSIAFTHQVLNPLAQTTRTDVNWGNLLTNNVRQFQTHDLLSPSADVLPTGNLWHLGDVGRGAADPAGIALCDDGSFVVASAGTGDLLGLGPNGDARFRVSVGTRPTALLAVPKTNRVLVADTSEDTITIFNCNTLKVENRLSLGAAPPPNAVERGEMVFHYASLSHDGWLSCGSCHTDGHTNGGLNDNLGDGSYGAPKRVLSLRGVKDTGPWAWNGSMPDLESQIRKSVRTTMHGPRLSDDHVNDLAAFLRSLPPVPPLDTAKDAVQRGSKVFREHGCDNCHVPPTYTSRKTYDVGLTDELGNDSFNPPSLRGVGQGGPYFHDNRAATLEEVLGKFKHQLKRELTKSDRDDLVQFLQSL